MEQDFLSLAFYTVIAQTATGTFLFREFLPEGRRFGISNSAELKWNRAVIPVLLAVAAGISFIHLGKPAHSINALRNLRTSWLSREILFMCILVPVLAAYYFINGRDKYKKAAQILKYISIATGILFLVSMAMLYLLPTVRSWYHPSTPVSFFLTSAICGIMLSAILENRLCQHINRIATILIIIFVPASMVNSAIYFTYTNYNPGLLLILRMILPVIAAVVLVLKNFRNFSNNSGPWSVIVFVLLFAGELINRIIFFLSFDRSGL